MATPGPKPKPSLAVVKEGNPSHRPVRDSAQLPPSALREPDWSEWFVGNDSEGEHARGVAQELWRRLAPTLTRSVGLVGEQQETLVDLCITIASIKQGERALSRDGVVVSTERGQVKHGWTAPLNQYRAHYRSLIGELGLSPASATRITRPESSSDDDPFD